MSDEHDPAAGGSRAHRTRLRGARIVLVDDDPDTLDLVARLLAEHGAEVATASSAMEAVALVRSCPDVIVSDIGMPECDGFQLMRRIRARPPHEGGATPAIALTAHVDRVDHSRALLAGYQLHIAKPMRIATLIAAIEKLLTLAAVEKRADPD